MARMPRKNLPSMAMLLFATHYFATEDRSPAAPNELHRAKSGRLSVPQAFIPRHGKASPPIHGTGGNVAELRAVLVCEGSRVDAFHVLQEGGDGHGFLGVQMAGE